MRVSGEIIRQEAVERERSCPKGMKDSFYYGFREGAKWMQHMFNEEGPIGEDTLREAIEVNSLRAAKKQREADIAAMKSKVAKIIRIATDPTRHLERKQMDILAMIQMTLEEKTCGE